MNGYLEKSKGGWTYPSGVVPYAERTRSHPWRSGRGAELLRHRFHSRSFHRHAPAAMAREAVADALIARPVEVSSDAPASFWASVSRYHSRATWKKSTSPFLLWQVRVPTPRSGRSVARFAQPISQQVHEVRRSFRLCRSWQKCSKIVKMTL